MDAQAGDSQAVEYEALWQQVKQQTGSAFEQWVNLIKFVVNVKDIHKVREVFDDFLAKYPLCYGYWMQYVGAEVAVGDQADAVLERGVSATPYSIEMWLHYIDRVRKTEGSSPDAVRTLFARAAQYVSIDWHAHKLLDKWIEYESSQQDLQRMTDVYTSALGMPMKELKRTYAAFVDLAAQHPLSALVSQEAVDSAVAEAKQAKLDSENHTPELSAARTAGTDATTAAAPASGAAPAAEAARRSEDLPPGAEEPPGASGASPGAGTSKATSASPMPEVEVTDEEVKAVWLERHRRTYEATLATANARSAFELRIKRRWWHYKPLDPEQLLTWWLFLDEVQSAGDEHTTYGLFERCLVPCASYPEFWSRYLCFLNRCTTLTGLASIRAYALSRASHIFCTGRPDMLLTCALLHEIHGDIDAATAIFHSLHTTVAPRSLECVSRHANFQRRIGHGPRALELVKGLLAEFRTAGDEATVVWLAQLLCVMEVSVERGKDGLVKGEPLKALKADGGGGGPGGQVAATPDAKRGSGDAGSGQGAEAGGGGGSGGGGTDGAAGGVVGGDGTGTGRQAAKDGSTGVALTSEGSSSATVDVPVDGSAEAELTQVLTTNPSNEGAWSAAITAIELKYFGTERANKVLLICRQAVSATVPQAGGVTQGTPTPALPFATREAHIASALAAMDLYGTPSLMWEVMEMSVGMQGEVLQQAVQSHKRPVSHEQSMMQQPTAKRHMSQHPAQQAQGMDPHAQYYQQQAGYNYSAYYQQQHAQQQQTQQQQLPQQPQQGYYGYGPQ